MPVIDHIIQSLRRQTYRLADGSPRSTTSAEAGAFINEVGFCLLSPNQGMELPSLRGAADATPTDLSRWKDSLPAEGKVYYGRIFQRRAAFVSLAYLPALYALSATAALNGDRFELYQQRYISREVNQIAGILKARGPLATRSLRRQVGMASKHDNSRFHRALTDAEDRFLAVKAGTTTTDYHRYSYLWDAFENVWPDIPVQANQLDQPAAGRLVIHRYLKTVHAACPANIARLFGLYRPFVDYIADQLVGESALGRVTHGEETYLVSEALLDRLGR